MRNISLALLFFLVLTSIGCGGAEDTPKNVSNIPANAVSQNSVNASSTSDGTIAMANSGRDRDANSQNSGVQGNVKPLAHAAPENSEFTMTLTDVGTETRTFKNHPQIDKVVKIIKPGSSSIKIYLKNGKVVDVAGDKIASVKMVSSAEILAAAGVKIAVPPPPPAGSQDATEMPIKKP